MKMELFHRFFSQNKKIFLLFLCTLSCFFFFTEATFAAEEGNVFIDVVNGGIKIISAFLGLLTAFVALFLYPGWVNGTIFGLETYLKEMWILISNVVYFVFAFILIAIAFMNIIGKGDKWELKSALPRFIIGVLIVPFSWFFVQFVLSISAILTVGVLTLPYDTFQDKDIFDKIDSNVPICTHLELYLSSVPENSGGGGADDGMFGEFLRCQEDSEFTIQEILSGEAGEGGEGIKNSIFGITSIYTYGILGLEGIDTIKKNQLEGDDAVKAILDLGVKAIFDLLFIVMYFILMAALFLALFVRGIWLWMYAMFSPAFGLLYFFEKGKEGVGGGENKFSITEFISLALVPVYVSAALSFGLVFLFVASQGIKDQSDGEDTLDLGGFKLTILGEAGNGETEVSTLARLIIQIFGLAMLWIAVMAALKQSSVTEKITAPIAQFGGSVGSLVASAPMYAPIIPGGAGGGMSATALGSAGTSLKSAISGAESAKGAKFGQDFATRMGSGGDEFTRKVDTLNARFTDLSDQNQKKQLNTELADSITNLSDTIGNSFHRNKVSDTLGRAYGDKVGDEIKKARNPDDFARLILDIKRDAEGSGAKYGLDEAQRNAFIEVHRELRGIDDVKRLYGGSSAAGRGDDSDETSTTNVVNNINLTSSAITEVEGLVDAATGKTSNVGRVSDIIKEALGDKTITESDLRRELEGLKVTDEGNKVSIITRLRTSDKIEE